MAYTWEKTGRLAQDMSPQEITVTQDETFTGRHRARPFLAPARPARRPAVTARCGLGNAAHIRMTVLG